jgi:hypothetical protein
MIAICTRLLLLGLLIILSPIVLFAQSEVQNPQGGTFWKLKGNSGTNPAINFIGTTDNVALSLRLNNQWAGRLDHINNNYSIGPLTLSLSPTGTRNVAFGSGALYRVSTGTQNVAIGNFSQFFTNTGSFNTSVGDDAADRNLTGNANTVIGNAALYRDTLGNNNVAIGRIALFNNYSGSNNTAVGTEAGVNNQGSGNVFLGRAAGANEAGNDKLYLDNSNTANPLLYGDFLTNLLRVNGTLNVNNAYSFPTIDGAANHVLSTNGAGVASWVSPSSLVTSAWNINGNSGTNPATNFIGTTDNVALSFRVNNQWAGRLDHINDNYSLGPSSLSLNPTGTRNVAFGTGALYRLSTGSYNVAIGNYSQFFTNTGSYNTSVGDDAANRITTGAANTALGHLALYRDTSGNDNLALGRLALYNNYNGSNNTALGTEAGANNTGSGNVFVGRAAGSYEAGSDKLYIDNSNTATPLLYGDFFTDLLRVNGTLNINNAYSLPTADGTANYVLTTNGTGTVNWDATTTTAWGLTGNAGTTANTNFIGTTDFNPLVFKVNNTWAGILDNTTGSYAIGLNALALNSGAGNVAFGDNALANNNSGINNSAIGQNALTNNQGGINNVAVGKDALSTMLSSSANTAVGKDALKSANSDNNTALGESSLYALTLGGNNVGIGHNALHNNSNGSFNVALGQGAGYSNTGSSNVFLGRNAGYNELGSNKLYIDNTNTISPLVYGDFNTNIVEINGKLGVGVTPVRELEVNGNIDASNNVYAGTTSTFGAMTFGAANATAGTVGSSGYSRLTNGMILQWATMQLTDNSGATAYTWTYPTAFPGGVMSVTATNASRAGGQTSVASSAGIPVVGATSATTAQLYLRNTGTVGTQCWVTIMAIGW